MPLKILLSILTVLLFTAGCSLEKRTYRPGYHVSWKKQHSVAASLPDKEKDKETAVQKEKTEAILPAASLSALSEKTEVPPAPVSVEEIGLSEKPLVPAGVSSHSPEAQDAGSVKEAIFESDSYAVTGSSERSKGLLGLIIGIILVFLGLSPFGVLVANGGGTAFWSNLILWLTAIILIIVGTVALSASSFLGVIFWIPGIILAIFSVIHALIVIIAGK